MIIGVPKKSRTTKTGCSPAGAYELTKRNHTIYIQSTAGEVVVLPMKNIKRLVQISFLRRGSLWYRRNDHQSKGAYRF